MLGLRYFVCDRCDTVHSGVEAPSACARCEHELLAEITASVQGDSYFTRAGASGR